MGNPNYQINPHFSLPSVLFWIALLHHPHNKHYMNHTHTDNPHHHSPLLICYTGAPCLRILQVSVHPWNSEYDHQAARADNNNNTMLRVPKLNLPRLPWSANHTQIATTTGKQHSKTRSSCGYHHSLLYSILHPPKSRDILQIESVEIKNICWGTVFSL